MIFAFRHYLHKRKMKFYRKEYYKRLGLEKYSIRLNLKDKLKLSKFLTKLKHKSGITREKIWDGKK